MELLLILIVGFALTVGLAGGLFFWARWLAKSGDFPRLATAIKWSVPAIVLANLAVTVAMLLGSFAQTARAQPEEKAKVLAAGISAAMNCHAFGDTLLTPLILVLLALTFAGRRR